MVFSIKSDNSSRKKVLLFSLVFTGLAHIVLLKQYIKGGLFALAEIIFLINLPSIASKIFNFVTLGTPHPELPIKQRDHSIFMLIDGVMIIAVICFFIILYFLSVKSALSDYDELCINKKFQSNKQFLKTLGGKSFPVVGLAPTLIMVVFFVMVPLVFAALVAFTNYSTPDHLPPNNTVDWVGLDNFVSLFNGNNTWTSALVRVAIWTLVWGAAATFTCYFGGMIVSVVLHESKLKIAPVFRSIFILPYAVPAVVSMLVWQNLLNGSFGTINKTLMAIGLINTNIPWLGDQWMAKFTTVLINLWAGFPYFMMLTTGTMTAIPSDIFEAARIDGANKFQTFRNITFPMVLYQTMPLVIMSFTHNVNNFGAIFFLTGGNPPITGDTVTTGAGGTDILVSWIYKLTVVLLKYNYASVLAVMIFIVLAPFAIINFRRTKSYKEGEL